MNILLITSAYPPEIRSSSQLFQELAEGLHGKGYNITVITCYPKYNLTDSQKKEHFPLFSVENDIEIVRVRTLPHHKVNFIVRGISHLLLPPIFYYNIKKYVRKDIDVVIVYSPPLTLAKVGIKIKKRYKAKYILNAQDIFPQNAVDLGILKNRLLIKLFESIEKRAYSFADEIVVHSKSNKLFLLDNKRIPESKLHVIHNWIDISRFDRVNNTGRFRKKYGIDDKFVFLFGGVVGPSQALDLIVKAASKMKEFPGICFLIVGDGTEKERLIRMTSNLGVNNVLFKSFVSKDEYPELVKDADVGLVCLSSKNRTPVVPGKILGYMAAGIPVVAFLNKESDGHSVIADAGCGYTTISDDEERVIELLSRVCQEKDRLKSLGKNGYNYAKNHFEKNICLRLLEELF